MFRVLALITFSLLAATTSRGSAIYDIIDLGNLGENPTFASALSNNRKVTGNSTITPAAAAAEPSTGSRLRAFSWSNGVMTNLGALPGAGTNRFARGFGINDNGVVVGEFNNDASRAFVYSPSVGAMVGLTRLAGDNDRGVATDINNNGVIVGASSNGTVTRATRWTDPGSGYVPADLGSIDGTANFISRATAINANGAVTGFSRDPLAMISQATLWDGNSITDLNSLGNGSQFSQGNGLNDANVVVGQSNTGQTVGQLIGGTSTTPIIRGFVWQTGSMIELPPFDLFTPTNNGPNTNYHSYAADVNNDGIIIGRSERIQGLAAVATLWMLNDPTPIDLNTLIPANSGWLLRSALRINDAGDIVGFGTFNGETRGFLLTIPETGSIGVAMCGVFCALRRNRRQV